MRLICPSCGAQYEVDESVIPDGGRDVQCSNCGHAWFQRSARQLMSEAEEAERKASEPEAAEPETPPVDASPEPAEPDPVEPEPAEVADSGQSDPAEAGEGPDSPAGADAADEPGPADEPEAEDPADADPRDDGAEVAAPAPERPRKTLDDAVRNVLREEAERETRARLADGTSVESQPDLGLMAATGAATAGGRAAEAAPERMASFDDEASDFDDDALVSRASRRELLPDIEEINSTLRATSERGGEAAAMDAPETLARRRSGFRMGFSTALLVALVAVGLYLLASTLAQIVPALEPALTSYVAAVDAMRTWLDDQMRSLTESIKGTSES